MVAEGDAHHQRPWRTRCLRSRRGRAPRIPIIAYLGALNEDDTPIACDMAAGGRGYSVRLSSGTRQRPDRGGVVTKGLATRTLRPVIDRIFKFDDMGGSHAFWKQRYLKIVV